MSNSTSAYGAKRLIAALGAAACIGISATAIVSSVASPAAAPSVVSTHVVAGGNGNPWGGVLADGSDGSGNPWG